MQSTRLIVVVLVIAVLGDVALSASLRPYSLQAGVGRIDVKTYGAAGDGKADDTAAIQTAIDRAPNGSTIYFPPGTYLVNNFQVLHRAGLQFEGEAASSIIRRLGLRGDPRIATFEGSTGIVIGRLTFDANGIDQFGGVAFHNVQGVWIGGTRFFDSRPQGPGSGPDHESYVFVGGTDIAIVNNQIEDLQIQVDHARNVRIEGNRSVRAAGAGIGLWCADHGGFLNDVTVRNNTIIDPLTYAMPILIDDPNYRNCAFRRIRIEGNRIVRSTTMASAILLGTGDYSVPSSGSVFEDITIARNIVEHRPGAPPPGKDEPIIALQSALPAGFDFQRVMIRNNELIGNGAREGGWAMDLRRIHNSIVEGNVVRAVGNGIAIIDNQKNSRIQGNTVGASNTAYHFSYSAGGNRLERNGYFGNPAKPLEVAEARPSDVIEQPRLVAPPPRSAVRLWSPRARFAR